MSEHVFKKIEGEEAKELLDVFNPALDLSDFDLAETTIMSQELDFYDGHALYDLADHSTLPPKHAFLIYKKGEEPHPLTWTNDPIYDLNESIPIKLNKDNIEDYVRFFFRYVRGKKGRFILVENVDDIPWSDDPPPAARKAIGEMIESVSHMKKSKEGFYVVGVNLVFKNSLFRTDVLVSDAGLVKMDHEELLVDDLPVVDELFSQ